MASNQKHAGVTITKDERSGERDTLVWQEPQPDGSKKRKRKRFKGFTKKQLENEAIKISKEIQKLKNRFSNQNFVPVPLKICLIDEWANDQEVSFSTLQDRQFLVPTLKEWEEQDIKAKIQDANVTHLDKLRQRIFDIPRKHKRSDEEGSIKLTTKNQRLTIAKGLISSIIKRGMSTTHLSLEEATYRLRDFKAKGKADQKQPTECLTAPNIKTAIEKLISLNQPEYAAYFALLLFTGMRVQELAEGKNWEVVCTPGRPQHIKLFAPKTQRERIISLSECPIAIDLLQALEDWRIDTDYKFGTSPKRVQQHAQYLVNAYLKPIIDQKITLRSLRATGGCCLVKMGLQDSQICERYGHTSNEAINSYRTGASLLEVKPSDTMEGALEIEAEIIQIIEQLRKQQRVA